MGNAVCAAEHTIKNKLGFHARPAALFVQLSSKFNSEISVIKHGETPADGKSLMSMLVLAATCGTVLTIKATGNDAEAAVTALGKLIDSGFDEE